MCVCSSHTVKTQGELLFQKNSHIFQTFPKVKLPFLVKQTARTWLYISGNCELCTPLLEMKRVLSHQLPHAILRLQKELGTSKLPFGKKEEKHMTHTTCHNPPATKIFSKKSQPCKVLKSHQTSLSDDMTNCAQVWFMVRDDFHDFHHLRYNMCKTNPDQAAIWPVHPMISRGNQQCIAFTSHVGQRATGNHLSKQSDTHCLRHGRIKDPDLIQAALHSSNSCEPLLEHELHLRHVNGSGHMADLGVFWKMMEMHFPFLNSRLAVVQAEYVQ